jgi:hypothetical protein
MIRVKTLNTRLTWIGGILLLPSVTHLPINAHFQIRAALYTNFDNREHVRNIAVCTVLRAAVHINWATDYNRKHWVISRLAQGITTNGEKMSELSPAMN